MKIEMKTEMKTEYVIIGQGVDTYNKILNLAKIMCRTGIPAQPEDFPNHYEFYILVDDEGKLLGWNSQPAGQTITAFLKYHTLDTLENMFLAESILNGIANMPWILSKTNPPKGYRLVTKDEMQNTFKPDTALWWGSYDKEWKPVEKTGNWNTNQSYCIPIDESVKSKIIELTLEDIASKFKVNVEHIRIKE